MLYEFMGKYYLKNDYMVIKSDLDNKKYKLESKDILDIKYIIDNISRFKSIEEIADEISLDLKTIEIIIEEFKVKKLIRVMPKVSNVFIKTDNSRLTENVMRTLCTRNNIKNIFFEINNEAFNVSERDLIVYINMDILNSELDEIELLATEKNSNLLNITLTSSGVLLGPLFSSSGGPCNKCLQKHNFTHKNKYSKPSIISDELYGDLIFNEIINILKPNTPAETFERVIEIDFSTLDIKKHEVYQIPGCEKCRLKIDLY